MKKPSNKSDKVVLLDIDYTIFDTDKFKKTNLETYEVYEEVLPTLQSLHKIAHIGIFSEGDLGLQRMKLSKTDIESYFRKEHIYIVTRKHDVIEDILKKYHKKGKLFLVDDKLPVLYVAKKFMPSIFTIWVKRGIYALNQHPIEGFTGDVTVENLQEIIPLIEKL